MYSIEITGAGSELQGVGRLPDGRAVFVPGAIPGERVDIEITRDRGRFCEASLVNVARSSPDRIAPDCPHAGLCGGCQARHMRYARTLELKRQRVVDALERIGGLEAPEVLETLGCEATDRARNKAEYPIDVREGRFAVGAFARGSRRVIPLEDCLLQSEQSVRLLRAFSERLEGLPAARHLRFLVTRTNRRGEAMAVLCGESAAPSEIGELGRELPGLTSLWYCRLNWRCAHALDGACTRLWGDETLRERLNDLEFDISPQSFFQVNARQAELMYAEALRAAGVRPGCGLRVLDAYCGAGTISLSAARWAAHVTGIEIVPQAIENANRNARINGLQDSARFICDDAAEAIPRLLAAGERFDAAILDPPRRGAEPDLLAALARSGIPTLCYVSCNPATLARDVRLLREGGYRLEWARPVDMFPWTGHCEAVVSLSRATSGL